MSRYCWGNKRFQLCFHFVYVWPVLSLFHLIIQIAVSLYIYHLSRSPPPHHPVQSCMLFFHLFFYILSFLFFLSCFYFSLVPMRSCRNISIVRPAQPGHLAYLRLPSVIQIAGKMPLGPGHCKSFHTLLIFLSYSIPPIIFANYNIDIITTSTICK